MTTLNVNKFAAIIAMAAIQDGKIVLVEDKLNEDAKKVADLPSPTVRERGKWRKP